jgi:hypothetical protein
MINKFWPVESYIASNILAVSKRIFTDSMMVFYIIVVQNSLAAAYMILTFNLQILEMALQELCWLCISEFNSSVWTSRVFSPPAF